MVSCFMILLIHVSLERRGGGGGESLPSERQILQSDGVWNNNSRLLCFVRAETGSRC